MTDDNWLTLPSGKVIPTILAVQKATSHVKSDKVNQYQRASSALTLVGSMHGHIGIQLLLSLLLLICRFLTDNKDEAAK
jgi:hypothetical protein